MKNEEVEEEDLEFRMKMKEGKNEDIKIQSQNEESWQLGWRCKQAAATSWSAKRSSFSK